MSAYGDVQAALDGHLMSWIDSGSLECAWLGIAYEPTKGQPWARPVLMPSEPRTAGIGPSGLIEHLGIYQVSLFYPSGQGTGAIRDAADSLLSHFKQGTVLTYDLQEVGITRAYMTTMREEPDWIHSPVILAWSCYAPKS